MDNTKALRKQLKNMLISDIEDSENPPTAKLDGGALLAGGTPKRKTKKKMPQHDAIRLIRKLVEEPDSDEDTTGGVMMAGGPLLGQSQNYGNGCPKKCKRAPSLWNQKVKEAFAIIKDDPDFDFPDDTKQKRAQKRFAAAIQLAKEM